MTTAARQPKGVPVGGQFAATAHAEPEGAQLVNLKIGEPRPMTREELVITGQAVENNPALSEIARQVHHNRQRIELANKMMDKTMLDATVIHVRQILPGAREVRVRPYRLGDQHMVPTFVRTANDDFIGANYAKGENADWATRTVEGADPGSVTEALAGVSLHSDIWDTDPRCDYDPQTEEHIIYLDGRRRQEH
jgi:hypothetical protein